MEVIKLNKLEDWCSTINCRGCNSELKFGKEDLKYMIKSRYYPYAVVNDDAFYVVCPPCNYGTEIPKEDIPDAIFDSVVRENKKLQPTNKKSWMPWFFVFGAIMFIIISFVTLLIKS